MSSILNSDFWFGSKVTDYSSSSEESESSDEEGEVVGHDGTIAVSDIPRIM